MFSFHCHAKSRLFRLVAQNASFDPVSKRRMARDERLERYRRNAEKCLELAQTFNDQERKRVMPVVLVFGIGHYGNWVRWGLDVANLFAV